MHFMWVLASTVAENLEDEEKNLREARERLGPDWTVNLVGVPEEDVVQERRIQDIMVSLDELAP